MFEKYPLLIEENFLDLNTYKKLNKFFDNFNNLKSYSFGQRNRSSVLVDKNNFNEFKTLEPAIFSLYNLLTSDVFFDNLANHFGKWVDPPLLKKELINADLEINFSVAKSGYENPFHVDTKKRLVHGLIYFETEKYKGGELALALPINKNEDECDQIPFLKDLHEFTSISPKNNLSAIILSNPESYHKGCHTVGVRKFVYWALNNPKHDLWKKNESFDNQTPFHVGNIKQKHPMIYKIFGEYILRKLSPFKI